MEIQRACFDLYHQPSAYALPPVLPVASYESFEKAHREWKTNSLLKDWSPFVLSRLFLARNILVAGPTPLLENRLAILRSLTTGGLEMLPYSGGFYISEIDSLSNIEPFKEYHRIPVRVLRFQMMRITRKDPLVPWWKGIEWTIEEEKWFKLQAD